MKAWDIKALDVEQGHPMVLDSEQEGRVIAIRLGAGERLAEHRVHERAWLFVAAGSIEIDEVDGETVGGGAGMLAEFAPNEPREIRAIEDSRLVLLLSPWPGEGHPSASG